MAWPTERSAHCGHAHGRSRTMTLTADPARGSVRTTARVKVALTTATVMVRVSMRSTQAVWRASPLIATAPKDRAAMDGCGVDNKDGAGAAPLAEFVEAGGSG